MQPAILIVDDEESIRINFSAFLQEIGCRVWTAGTYAAAMERIGDKSLDAVIVDIILKDHSGMEILREVRNAQPFCPVIMITGAPDIDTSAEAVRRGAFDYLIKPVRRADLVRVVQHALQRKALEDQNERYRRNQEAILSTLSDVIITIDDQKTVTQANQAAAAICGLASRAIVGRRLEKLPFVCSRACMALLQQSLSSGESVNDRQLACNHRDRPGQIVRVNCAPLYDYRRRSLGAILVARDITRLNLLERELKERYRFANIIGRSRPMQDIFHLIEELSGFDTTVLITGESGTGKELIGKAIHYSGSRRERPLITVNCSALAEDLLESELFGHRKGAFTGAVDDRVGRFQMAHRGTIFLDEIGDVSSRIQQRLLRVLQEKAFERVGDSTSIHVDVRILAATNTDLKQLVQKGTFRSDLYYRLNVVELHLPALRERREDIPLLTAHICRRLRRRLKKDITAVADNVMDTFMTYDWPGNIRELENAMEHAFILCHESVVRKQHLPPDIRDHGLKPPPPTAVGGGVGERQTLLNALEKTDWNKAKTARILGMSRPTLYSKIQAYGLRPPRSGAGQPPAAGRDRPELSGNSP